MTRALSVFEIQHKEHVRSLFVTVYSLVMSVTVPLLTRLPSESATLTTALTTADLSLGDRKSTRLNSSHSQQSRMPSSA